MPVTKKNLAAIRMLLGSHADVAHHGLTLLKSRSAPTVWELFGAGVTVAWDCQIGIEPGCEVERTGQAALQVEVALWLLVMSGRMGAIRDLHISDCT